MLSLSTRRIFTSATSSALRTGCRFQELHQFRSITVFHKSSLWSHVLQWHRQYRSSIAALLGKLASAAVVVAYSATLVTQHKPVQCKDGRFAGKRVLVTGACMGIGRGIAQAFAEEGAHVFVLDIETPPPEDVSPTHSKGSKVSIQFMRCDCSKAAEIEACCEKAGHIDILVNNVAVQPEGACHEMTLEAWNNAIMVNLTSYFLFSKYLLPSMLSKKSGVILNLGSVQGQQSQPAIPGYAASKGGVLSLTRQLAMEYGPQGIRVLAISPGTIATPLVTGILERRGSSAEKAGAVYPMKRIGQISEIAKVALFLCSDEASFMTAENVNVDGGIMGLGGWAAVA